jgi:hypothetical protein
MLIGKLKAGPHTGIKPEKERPRQGEVWSGSKAPV